MTRNLNAEQWDKFIEKCNVEEHTFEPKIARLIRQRSKKTPIKVMREAIEKGLHFLFLAMAASGNSPQLPQTNELLEKGAEKYPILRSEFLRSIHMLRFPVNKWHFTSAQDDLNLLQELNSEKSLKRKNVIIHLAEVLEVDVTPKEDSGNLIELLMENKLLRAADFCDLTLYQKACGVGNMNYLKKTSKSCSTLLPDQKCIDEAVKRGHEPTLEYIEHMLNKAIVPSQQAVDAAATNGKLEILEVRCNEWNRFPSLRGANGAAMNGHLDALK